MTDGLAADGRSPGSEPPGGPAPSTPDLTFEIYEYTEVTFDRKLRPVSMRRWRNR
jgi:hypothetical protein